MALRSLRFVAFAWVALASACGTTSAVGDDAGRGPADASSPVDAGSPDVMAPLPDGAASEAGPDGGPVCDDGDPCTHDNAVDGGCEHTVAPDGTPCNDGARCTGGDRCMAGVCRGTELTPHVQARGHFVGFGAAANEDGQPNNGLGEFVSDDRVLFLDSIGTAGSALSLVRVTAVGLERLDTKKVSVSLGWDSDSPSNYRSRATTFVVPLGGDRTAVVATRQRIQIFDTSSDKIVSKAELALPPTADSILAATGRGSRLYTCQTHLEAGEIDAWEIDATSTIHHRSRFTLPNTSGWPTTCSSLALSADGQELLVATGEGINRVDVTDPSVLAMKTRFAPGRDYWRVAVDGDFVVAQEPATWDQTHHIEVYRRSELEANPAAAPVTRFISTAGNKLPARWPLGFAFLDGGIAVEWKLKDVAGVRYVTEISALPGGAARSAKFVHRHEREDRVRTRAFLLGRRGRHLIVPPWRTVLRDDPVGDKLTALGGAEVSGFESLVPGAHEHMIALSGLGVHDINLHDADAPTVTGSPLPKDVSFYRWQPGGSHRLAAPIGDSEGGPITIGALTLKQKLNPVGCFAPAAGTIAPSGVVNIADENDFFHPGQVIDVGHALLQANIVEVNGRAVRLRWYDAPPACDGRTLDATVDGTVDVDPEHLFFGVGGSASGGPVAVLADLPVVTVPELKMTIRWLEREPGKSTWRTAARADLDSQLLQFAQHIEVHEDSAVIHDGHRMVVVRRNGSTLDVVAHREIRDGGDLEELSEILGFDGELVYASTTKSPYGVVVLRARDLERIARFPTHGLVRSMAEASGRIVFGSANAIDVVDALCPP